MKEKIISCLTVLPMASHWILPEGLERTFLINVLGLPIYLFDLAYLLYIYNYNNIKKVDDIAIKTRTLRFIIILSFLFVSYCILLGFINVQEYFFIKCLGNQWFLFSVLFFSIYPMDSKMIDNTKYILIPCAIILSLEVILFSLGILTYKEDLGTQEYGDIFRISTTIGAATGTAVILTMLGALILCVYNIKTKFRIPLIILLTIAIAFTISRGSILLWGVFLVIYYIRVLRTKKFKYKNTSIIFAFFIGYALYNIGVFNPVIERQKQLEIAGNIDSNRGGKNEIALQLLNSSNGLGIGYAETKADKNIDSVITKKYPLGVHSFFLNMLAEVGYYGTFIISLILLIFVMHFEYSKLIAIYSLLLILITFNSEPVFILSEFVVPTFFIFMISMKFYHKNANINSTI